MTTPVGRHARADRALCPRTDELYAAGLVVLTRGDRESERRALAHLTLHPNPPAVELYKFSDQGKPEAGALDFLGGRPHLAELLEDLFLILRGNADPGIVHRDLHESVPWYRRDSNASPLSGELDRIGQQVQDDLPDLALVSLDLPEPVIDVCLKGE